MNLYFEEKAHKYTDEFGFEYISTTTLIHNYTPQFETKERARACEKIGSNPNHPKYLKYKGMKAWQIEQMWKTDADKGCAIGNFHHNKLEDNINLSMYVDKPKTIITDYGHSLFTIDDIMLNPNYGRIDLYKLKKSEIYTEYPEVYNSLVSLINQGFSIYVEIGLFDFDNKISGLGDIIPIHLERRVFMVLDWKTNKVPITKVAGYYEKDNQRNILYDKFVATDEKFLAPLAHLIHSNYYVYGLQLNTYQRMIEQRGFKCLGRMIIHIRHETYTSEDGAVKQYPQLLNKHKINFVTIEDMQRDVSIMFNHNKQVKILNNNSQLDFGSIF